MVQVIEGTLWYTEWPRLYGTGWFRIEVTMYRVVQGGTCYSDDLMIQGDLVRIGK